MNIKEMVKKLALSGKYNNQQVCELLGINEATLQQILEVLLRNDREFQRASGFASH